MLGIVSEDENHNKIFKPMAGATLGQGVPLGTWCSFEKDVAPSNNWLMAGTTFDASVYPALNLYLGTNKVPNRYDHNRPSEVETIANFDTTYTTENTAYEVQNDGVMYFSATGTNGNSTFIIVYIKSKNSNSYEQIFTAGTYGGAVNYGSTTLNVQKGDKVYIIAKNGGTTTTVYAQWYTHPLFIKATSIASDTDQQAILAQIQAYNTYSTEETLTGKTWIDGKPIYRVVKPLFTDTETVAHNLEVTSYTIPNIDVTNWKQIISSHGTCVSGNSGTNSDELDGKARLSGSNNVFTSVQWQQKNNYNGVKGVYIVIEYTKNTD